MVFEKLCGQQKVEIWKAFVVYFIQHIEEKRDKVNGKFRKALVSFDLYSLAQKEDKERERTAKKILGTM